MKTAKEKHELINSNNVVLRKKFIRKIKRNSIKSKNNWLAYKNVHIRSLYTFLFKSFFKGWFAMIFLLWFFISFGLPFFYCFLISPYKNYYLGINIIYLLNSFLTTTFICLNCITYFKFTDLQNKIYLLNIKNLGYLFSVGVAIFCYVIISDIISLSTFVFFSLFNDIGFWELFNWTNLFFLLFSIFIIITFVIIYLFLILCMKSFKNRLLIFELTSNSLMTSSYVLFIFGYYWIDKFHLDLFINFDKLLLYYFGIFSMILIIDLTLIILFNKFYILKR